MASFFSTVLSNTAMSLSESIFFSVFYPSRPFKDPHGIEQALQSLYRRRGLHIHVNDVLSVTHGNGHQMLCRGQIQRFRGLDPAVQHALHVIELDAPE